MATPAQVIQFDNGRAEVFATHAWVYATGEHPVCGYSTAERRWAPFRPEFDSVTHRQVTSMQAGDAAARCGIPEAAIRQVEAAANAHYATGQAATERRLESGRRAWASMSEAERQAMDDYSMRTEGHT